MHPGLGPRACSSGGTPRIESVSSRTSVVVHVCASRHPPTLSAILPPRVALGVPKMARRVLISGGAGFVPSHLCDRFIADGWQVLAVDNFCTGRQSNIAHLLGNPAFELLEQARALPATAGILVECGRGTLPGGNGAAWNWADAEPLAALRPFALAGGLTPQNLAEAAALSKAVAWDVSSGVETTPGVKDHQAIIRAIKTLTDFLRHQTTPIDSGRFWSAPVDSSRSSSTEYL